MSKWPAAHKTWYQSVHVLILFNFVLLEPNSSSFVLVWTDNWVIKNEFILLVDIIYLLNLYLSVSA